MNFLKQIFHSVWANRKLRFAALLVILVGGYFGYKQINSKTPAPEYIMAQVVKGTLTVSVSGTGQVSASNQIDIKPKVSGDIIAVGVINGQAVKAGDVITRLDSREAQKTLRDAQSNLDSAALALEKLKQPADSLALLQSENTLARAKESKQVAEAALQKAYTDGYNNVADAFLDLPSAMSGLQDILYSNNLGSSGQWNIDFYYAEAAKYDATAYNFKTDTQSKLEAARAAYDKNFQDYKVTTRTSPIVTLENLINETYATAIKIAEAVTSTNNLIQFFVDKLTIANKTPSAAATIHLSNLSTYTGQLNGHLTVLLASKNEIVDQEQGIINAGRTIDENSQSLEKLKNGADELDVKSSELTLKQRQNAVLDAREKLADYTLRAPLDGMIAKVSAKKGDVGSSATAVATLITKQQVVEVSLNEVDVAKVKLAQKAILTFDAVEGLTITGTVADVESIGAATQGVVNYLVRVSFDTQDDRVKPGMSVSANIITQAKLEVLLVPASAVKTQGNSSYVEVLENGAVVQKPVGVGLSNDTLTEIVSGLAEGQNIITQTIAATPATAQTPNRTGNSLIPTGGGAVFRAGGVR